MALQRCINWFVSHLFKLFAPRVTFFQRFPEAIIPSRPEGHSLGYVLYTPHEVILKPGERIAVDTGVVVNCPSYLAMFLWDRFSVASEEHLSVCAGVVDPDYRGSVEVLLENRHPERLVVLPPKTAIAQAVFHFAVRPVLTPVADSELLETSDVEHVSGKKAE